MTAFLLGALVYTFLAYHVTCWPFVEHFGCALKTRWITAGLLCLTLWSTFAVSLLLPARTDVTRREWAILCALVGVFVAYVADGTWWSIEGTIKLGRLYVEFP